LVVRKGQEAEGRGQKATFLALQAKEEIEALKGGKKTLASKAPSWL
jgi:hypothetical protein